jgi:uncharacterized membrane protein YfcA
VTAGQFAVVAVAFVLAGIAKGAIGMGLPPVAIGLMTLAIPLEEALAMLVLPTIATNVWQAVWGHGFLRLLRRFWTMAVAAVAGLLAVALAGGHLGSPTALAWVGVVLVLYALLALTAWRPSVPQSAERWANPLVGLASGAVAGVTGVAAVPFLPYMQSLDIGRDDLVQALGIMFLFIMGALAAALALQGSIHVGNLPFTLAAVAPTFLGVWLGQKARAAVSAETFRLVFLLGLLGIGLHMARALL